MSEAGLLNTSGWEMTNKMLLLFLMVTRDTSGTGFIPSFCIAFLDFFSPGQSKHPVFGKVTDGLDVVEKIEKTETDGRDRPVEPVQMIRITVSE